MYVQVSISNNPLSVQFETLQIRGHISDHTLSHVATTRNYQHQVLNEDGLMAFFIQEKPISIKVILTC